ncbi:MAG: hypothetical protein H6Q15_280 [Bacteroidetes bacterium]|nr:hypothetical protein [Bacteroidota bacterium]
MPYIGYFQLMKVVDKYVIYDDVNYIKGGWINRNNILINSEKRLFTIALDGASPNKKINEILIKDDFTKFLRSLELSYHKAPYFEQGISLMRDILKFEDKNLSLFIGNSFRAISNYLDFNTEFLYSSKIEKDNELRAEKKVISICKSLGASEYYNAIGGKELYSKENFETNGLKLHFLKTNQIEYKQFGNVFVPNLSIIDILMFNSKAEINQFLDNYTLE